MNENFNGLYSEDMADVQGVTSLNALLDDLGLELISDNIGQQINGTTTSTIDFLSIIIIKFRYIIESEEIDSEDKSGLKSEIIDFCGELITRIADEYNIFVNLIDEGYETYIFVLSTLYDFFVLNKINIVEVFINNYIENNKVQLIELLELEDNKDISTLANRKKNYSKEDLCILAGISDVIDFIKNSNVVESSEFIDTINNGELFIDNLNTLYVDGIIGGNFVHHIILSVLGDTYDSSESIRIRNNIRAYYYGKY